jgi:molybdate transport system ATP-binding protein
MQPDQAGAKVVPRSGSPWISLENVTIRLRQRWYLRHTSWEIRLGEMWAIVGANGSGKTTLARTLLGEMPVVGGRVVRHYLGQYPAESGRVPMAYVAPEQTRQLVARARWQDRLMEFSAGRCRERRVVDLLREAASPLENKKVAAAVAAMAAQTGIGHLLDTPVQALSSGETARVLFARALVQGPRLLILDEPFNGLDARARSELVDLVMARIADGLKIVLITHRPAELLPAITHLALLEAGRIKAQGPREAVAPLWVGSAPEKKSAARHPTPPIQAARTATNVPPLIEMRSVRVTYGEKRVLDRISWAMYPGQHWAIAGPNGAGKTTLLALISGDNLQAYSNEIYLFGRRRGSGESVWEIKKKIGLVTPHFHAGYQKRLTAFEAVCSGWFDSVGLYRRCSSGQKAAARHQMTRHGIDHLAEHPFDRLSHGQQRLVLIARALVKGPPLLILDEPCAGLDTDHRQILLAQLDAIAAEGASQLLYVTHHPDERPAGITHTLRLEAGRVVTIQEHRFSER